MKYECLEYRVSDHFNEFSKENDGKFEIINITAMSSRNIFDNEVETLYVMIKWL